MEPLSPENHATSTIETKNPTKRGTERALTYYKCYGTLVPTALAARDLKIFFDSIAYHAANTWLNTVPEQKLVTVTLGPLQLTFSSIVVPIPWKVIAHAAKSLSIATNRRLAVTFDAYYEDKLTFDTFAISLRLVQTFIQKRLQPKHPAREILQQGTPRSNELRAVTERTIPSPQRSMLAMTNFNRYVALVPTTVAAMQLEDFYTIIALRIETGYFKLWKPSKFIVLHMWDFELSFACDTMVIPWSFVQAFAMDMAKLSSREFSGFYEALVEGEGALKGLYFFVKMTARSPT